MVIFVAVNALPGDFAQAILGQGATEEAVTQIRADLGLDQNYFLRYFGWLGNVLTGNLGISFAQMNFATGMGGDQVSLVGVAEQIAPRFRATMFLAGVTAMIAVPVSVTLGILGRLVSQFVCLTGLSTSPRCRQFPALNSSSPIS